MDLPQTSTATLAHWDFTAGGVVQIQSTNSTATVNSVIDLISGQGAKQTVVANQPTFNRSIYGVAGYYHSLSFNGSSQVLTFDSLASILATLNSFTVFAVCQTSTPATSNMDVFTLGKVGADGYTRVGISGSAAFFSDKNDTPTVVSGSGGTIGSAITSLNVLTLINASGTMTLRLNGTQVAQVAVSGSHSYNTCTIAGLRNNGTTTNFFNGNLYEIIVCAKQPNYISIEEYLLDYYTKGINRVE